MLVYNMKQYNNYNDVWAAYSRDEIAIGEIVRILNRGGDSGADVVIKKHEPRLNAIGLTTTEHIDEIPGTSCNENCEECKNKCK